MPWARIDDGFDDHPKVLALLEHDDGAAAIGLWTLCLTWAHRNTRKKGKTPGLIPDSLPRRYLGTLGRGAAKLLVEVDLWEVADGGWQIHDFDQYLPTMETSSARSDAGKKGAAARWGKREETAGQDSNEPSDDGNLPSGVMANHGSGMAADSDVLAHEAAGAENAPTNGLGHGTDGKLPSSDGSLLSADGKPMASDGSRAPARRAISKEIAPTPGSRSRSQAPTVPAADAADEPLTETQRSKKLTDAYAEAEPMCKWVAVNGIVLSAIRAGHFADDEIRDGLLRLAAAGRSVTIDTLRTELRGFPAQPQRGGQPQRTATTDLRVAQAQSVKAQLAAMNQGDGNR